MNSSLSSPTFFANGKAFLAFAYVSLVVLVFWLGIFASDYIAYFPVLLLGLVGGVTIVTSKEWNLYLVLAGFVLIAEFQAGLQPAEIIYAAWLAGFFTVWYTNHLVLERKKLITNTTDLLVCLFALYALASASWSIAFGSRISDVIGEGIVMLMLAFYFPVKHTVVQQPQATTRLLAVFCFIGLFVFVRNIFYYQQGLSNAEQLYQIATGRVSTNEALQLFPAIGALVGIAYSKSFRQFVLMGLAFACFFAGLVITQSRGYWVSFIVACLGLFLVSDRETKFRLLIWSTFAATITIAVGYAFLPDIASLILGGLWERMASLGSAFSSDLSFVNRVFESRTVWERIIANPVLGYGMGASYFYFSIIEDTTSVKAFVHNGYLGLWYKFGLLGLIAVLACWISSVREAILHFRYYGPGLVALSMLAIGLCLLSLAIVANTSNPFLVEDTMLMFSVFAGYVSGIRDKRL